MRKLILFFAFAMASASCTSEPVDTTATTSPAPSTTTSTHTTTSLSPTTTEEPATGSGAVYLFFEGYPVAPGPYLAPAARTQVEELADAIDALLAGPSPEEATMGLSSTIPPGTSLLGVEVSDGVASVDLSPEFESGGGSLSMMGRVAQVVYTATRFENVDAVRFLIDGQPLEVLGGEGLMIDQPQTRDDWAEHLTPPIFLEEPVWGQTVGSELEVAGMAEVESGEISYVIVDADGLIIDQGGIGVTPGKSSQFAASVTLGAVPHPGLGSVIVWEWAPDGSQRHVLEYPITIED